jgi:hypothetical protein
MRRELPSWIDGFVEYTENTEPAYLFRKWVGIAVVAAALRRKGYLEWGLTNFYPNMYIVLVGPPGSRKGTAMGPGAYFLRYLGIPVAAEAITREALIKELKNSIESVQDPKTGQLLMHSSLTVFSPELTVFLGYNNVQLMADLADWYDCADSWTYRTKNVGTDQITGVYVNLLGATTPEMLQTTMPRDAIGGGLTSRMIFVYESKKGKICPLPLLEEKHIELEEKLKHDIEAISLLTGTFKITEEFVDLWVPWYTDQEENPPFKDDRFAGYFNRRPSHALKLSMIMSAARSNKLVMEKCDLESAIELLEATEKKMVRAFGGIGQTKLASVMEKILQTIRIKGRIELTELQRMYYYDADNEELSKILGTLSASDYITINYKENGRTEVVLKRKE